MAARDFHVSVTGNDAADGLVANPLRTIAEAASRAMPGDVITASAGVYRERIDPPRGGESDEKRIIYQAAPGAQVVIKGSEVVKGWEKTRGDIWRLVLPNSFFGFFNPYADEIRGDWFKPLGRKHHTGAVYLEGHWLVEAATLDEVMGPAGKQPLWFATVDENHTTITARFPGVDPNVAGIEINARQTVFYPSKTGRNFITVRGFTMEHAATNWAPPTAEQVGLIGTHWSKGWIIEGNTIRYSTCSGVTLGKHGDRFDNTSANSAEGYVETIKRGLAAGWSRENIGHHVVRNNHISHCEQTGICGSLGAAFSTITGNEIHHIHIRRLFGGAEQAGIKIHAAIDSLIAHNHIHHTNRGIWLDWMAQGTRVTGNLLHDNSANEDLFMEVNHGPFLVDHNIFLSQRSLSDMSQGGAYAHNLFAGTVTMRPEPRRDTPWLEQHGTDIAGLSNIKGGDNRFYYNLFFGPAGLEVYDNAALPVFMEGNRFLKGAKPSKHERSPQVPADANAVIRLEESGGKWLLEINTGAEHETAGHLVTSEFLAKAAIPGLAYVQPDGTSYQLDRDYFGTTYPRPRPGPFAARTDKTKTIQVWPLPKVP